MKTWQFITFLLICLIPSVTYGQKDVEASEQSHGIFQTPDEYDEFMRNIKRESVNDPELRAMVPMINDLVLGNPIGSTAKRYNTPGSTLGLLADPNVRKDLEMVEDQYKDLQHTNAAIQKRAEEQLREIDFSNLKNAVEQIRKIRTQSENELQTTLLPHQMDRLRQIVAQSQLRHRSLVDILTSEPMKTRLEISDDQSDQLKAEEEEIKKDLEKKIAQLRIEARDRLLSKLKPGQQSKVEEIFGDAFAFEQDTKSKRYDRKREKK